MSLAVDPVLDQPTLGAPRSPAPDATEPSLAFGAGRMTAATAESADPMLLMAAVGVLSPRDIECLDEAESEAYVVACERVAAAVHARQSLAMDTLATRVDHRLERQRADRPLPQGVPVADAHAVVASMLAPALHCSTRAVRKRLEADRWLVCTSESTFAAQWDGDLERFRADVVVDAARDVDPELRAAFEAMVLETNVNEVTGELILLSEQVRAMSRAQLARRATAIARELDPESHERARRRAHEDRRVVVAPDRRPGVARWRVLLPSDVSQEVFAAVDALAGQYARANPGTAIDGHRADALADLVLGNAQVTTTVELVVPVREGATDRLQSGGPAEHPDAVSWFVAGPADVGRHGVLLPVTVAELLSRPETLVRLTRLDPDGSLVQDPRTYRPGHALRRRIRSRDGTCRFPGCRTPAQRCDIDHVVAHPRGPTDLLNLMCLCRTHHRFKHHGGWRVRLGTDGVVTWCAPDGRRYTTRPALFQGADGLGHTPFTDGVRGQIAHDLRRGWFPGLPMGMSLADLALAEAALPDDPPESDACPEPPVDWQELDALVALEHAPAGAGRASVLEDHLIRLWALAA